jgi:hypothetical protein
MICTDMLLTFSVTQNRYLLEREREPECDRKRRNCETEKDTSIEEISDASYQNFGPTKVEVVGRLTRTAESFRYRIIL